MEETVRMMTRFGKPKTSPFVLLISGLLVLASIKPACGFVGVGPGTQGAGVPQPFSIRDFDSFHRLNRNLPTTMSPGVRHALGGCVDAEGNPPNHPVGYDLSLRTVEDVSAEWKPGEERELILQMRSSSIRWFKTPPQVDMILIGGNGRDILIGGLGADSLKSRDGIRTDPGSQKITAITDGTSNTILFTVPEVPAGLYRIDVYERTTGICKSSDFTFRIAGEGSTGTPTPTPTGDLTATPTPTGDGTTPTRTPRIPDYDNSLFVNGFDLPEFLKRLAENNEEADLDGEDLGRFRDLFMFSLWWQNDELPN